MTAPLAARAAYHYTRRLGWGLVPIPPASKGPRTPGWQAEPVTDPDVAWRAWGRKPTWGMGLLHAASGTATVDADDRAEHVALALAAVGVDYPALLQAPGPQLVGDPAKPPKLLYRLPAGLQVSRHPLRWPETEAEDSYRVIFELRAGLVQDVLPPSVHPGTGRRYGWAGTGCPRRPEDVPLLPDELAALWTSWRDRVREMEAVCPWADPPPRRSPPRRRPRRPGEPSTIELYNELVPVELVLERNGYRECRGRWLAPGSCTGTPGVVILDGRAYSHHASDPLSDGHAHDSFGALAALEHGGDVRAAVRAAREELGLRVREGAEARANLTCSTCGEPFEASRSDGKYCGSACRQKAYRERQEEAE